MIHETDSSCPPTLITTSPTFQKLITIWKSKLQLIYYLIIFVSGIFFSFLFFFVLSRSPKQLNLRHNLPEANYLQVRDEFPVVSPYAAGPEFAYQPSKKTKSKNSEGTQPLIKLW